MRKTLTFAGAAVLALGAGVAVAQTEAHMGHRGPMAADTDGDGTITRAEAVASAKEHFVKLDVNGDGQLSKADREARMAERFAETDADGNGEISFAEMEAQRAQRRQQMFEKLDTDQSGGLSEAELAKAHEGRRGWRMAHRGHGRGGPGGAAAMLRKADTDGDQALSYAEFETAALGRFTRADADGDGQVTQAEREAMRDKWQERREQRRERRGQRGDQG